MNLNLTHCGKPWTYMAAEELTLCFRWETRNQLQRGTVCLQAKNIIVSLSLCVRLRGKKNQNLVTNYIIFFSNILRCAGADRCSPVCQVQHCSICENADQLLFASVFQCRHTSGKQKLYQKALSVLQRPGEPIQTQVRKTGRGLRISKQTFHLTLRTLPSPPLFTHPGMYLLQLSNYFPKRYKYWIKVSVDTFSFLVFHCALPWTCEGFTSQNLTSCSLKALSSWFIFKKKKKKKIFLWKKKRSFGLPVTVASTQPPTGYTHIRDQRVPGRFGVVLSQNNCRNALNVTNWCGSGEVELLLM